MNVSESGLQNRPAMYWFDLRQQFGVPGVVLAATGIGYVMLRWSRRGLLLLLVYLVNLGFAWTYNVGDAYIFFLPSHYVRGLVRWCRSCRNRCARVQDLEPHDRDSRRNSLPAVSRVARLRHLSGCRSEWGPASG